jgi:hypothetical protein
MCVVCLEFGLFVLIACMCSLYLVLKFLLVFSLYILVCIIYISSGICYFGCVFFWLEVVLNCVLCSVGYFYVCDFNSLIMALVSFLLYVNVAHFCFCVVLGVMLLFVLVFVFRYVCVG